MAKKFFGFSKKEDSSERGIAGKKFSFPKKDEKSEEKSEKVCKYCGK